VSWYDNEWGYSNRVVDLVKYITPRAFNSSSFSKTAIRKGRRFCFFHGLAARPDTFFENCWPLAKLALRFDRPCEKFHEVFYGTRQTAHTGAVESAKRPSRLFARR